MPKLQRGDKVVYRSMNGDMNGQLESADCTIDGRWLVKWDKGGSAWLHESNLSKKGDMKFIPLTPIQRHHPHIDVEFQKLQQRAYQVFAKKMLDYGKDNISMGTALETDEEKKMALTATWTRMWDKMNRLKNLVVKGNEAQVNERIEDTYMDLANYALISLLVLNDDWK